MFIIIIIIIIIIIYYYYYYHHHTIKSDWTDKTTENAQTRVMKAKLEKM